jgi:hypothetical protein
VTEETKLNEVVSEVLENAEETPAISDVNNNPLLRRFSHMPPETFRLPSGGVFYTDGELDPEVVNGEVVVYPMTAIDEITIKSPDMLYQGSAIEKVFNRCIPQVLKPMKLLTKDVDYLMVCLRIVTYGKMLDLTWQCPPTCEKRIEKERIQAETKEALMKEMESGERIAENKKPMNPRFDGGGDPESSDDEQEVMDLTPLNYSVDLTSFLKKSKPLDTSSGFSFDLKTGEHVEIQPSTYEDFSFILQQNTQNLDNVEDIYEFVLAATLSAIRSVSGVTNREHIREWLEMCEAPVIAEIQDHMQVLNDWGAEFTHTFKCKECGKDFPVEVPLNPVSFFSVP